MTHTGVPLPLVELALDRANDGRSTLLDHMEASMQRLGEGKEKEKGAGTGTETETGPVYSRVAPGWLDWSTEDPAYGSVYDSPTHAVMHVRLPDHTPVKADPHFSTQIQEQRIQEEHIPLENAQFDTSHGSQWPISRNYAAANDSSSKSGSSSEAVSHGVVSRRSLSLVEGTNLRTVAPSHRKASAPHAGPSCLPACLSACLSVCLSVCVPLK